jgi:hypothetical protein
LLLAGPGRRAGSIFGAHPNRQDSNLGVTAVKMGEHGRELRELLQQAAFAVGRQQTVKHHQAPDCGGVLGFDTLQGRAPDASRNGWAWIPLLVRADPAPAGPIVHAFGAAHPAGNIGSQLATYRLSGPAFGS